MRCEKKPGGKESFVDGTLEKKETRRGKQSLKSLSITRWAYKKGTN